MAATLARACSTATTRAVASCISATPRSLHQLRWGVRAWSSTAVRCNAQHSNSNSNSNSTGSAASNSSNNDTKPQRCVWRVAGLTLGVPLGSGDTAATFYSKALTMHQYTPAVLQANPMLAGAPAWWEDAAGAVAGTTDVPYEALGFATSPSDFGVCLVERIMLQGGGSGSQPDLTPVFSCSNIKTMARDVKRRGGSIVTKVGEHNGKYQSFQAHDPAGNAMWMVHKFSRNPLLALHFACVDVAATAAWYRRELRLQTLDDGKYWLTDEQPVVVLGDSTAPNATVLCFYQATSSTIAPHGAVVLRALQNPQQGAALLSAPHSVWSAVAKDGLGVVGVATDPDGRPVVAAAASS